MCGFIGFIGSNDSKDLTSILNHRGPDSNSSVSNNYCTFIHNRLSIIDLSTDANQPMKDTNNGNIIVFNGEIYNYKELKNKYNNLQYSTNSDTEVLLKLYTYLGIDFINELVGIFSFAIFDNNEKKIILARDRFGVKPLYYFFKDNKFIFSSEIKGILPFVKSYRYEESSIFEYLEYGKLAYNEQTFFKDIVSLDAATILEYNIEKKQINRKKYWDIDDKTDYSDLSDSKIIDKTYELLSNSIDMNMVSDVEIALSLSSGIDSTLIANMALQKGQRFKAFSFGFKNSSYNEVEEIEKRWKNNSIDLLPVYLSKDSMLKTLKEATYYYETPLGGLGSLSSYNMMKEVKNHNIKVILSGEGADEIFSGYQYYYPAFFKDIESDYNLLEKELLLYSRNHNKNIIINSNDYKSLLKSIDTNNILAPDGTSPINSYTDIKFKKQFVQNSFKKKLMKSTLNELMYLDLTQKKLPKLLHFQDRSAMANSIEARVPFLDHKLASFIYSLDSRYKIKDGQTKYLLKRILKDKYGFVDKKIIKHYVATPQREWLKDKDIMNTILEQLRYSKLNSLGFINFDKFAKDYKVYSSSKELGNSFFIWKLINLEYLLESF